MNDEHLKVLAHRAVKKWGEKQYLIVCEELGELIQAISKLVRAKDNQPKNYVENYNSSVYDYHRGQLIEEICDVEIMLEQLKLLVKLEEKEYKEIFELKAEKLNRMIGLKF